MAMILRSAMRGATKTRMMYGAYLSYGQLKEYLSMLLNKRLLIYEEGLQIYRPTEKALQFLNVYDEFNEMLSVDEENSIQGKQEPTLKVKAEQQIE